MLDIAVLRLSNRSTGATIDASRRKMTTSVFTESFISDRMTAIQAMIVAYETAITSLSSGTTKSYTINTGQTTETVTKKDLVRLQQGLDELIGRLQYWDHLLCNTGTILARGNS